MSTIMVGNFHVLLFLKLLIQAKKKLVNFVEDMNKINRLDLFDIFKSSLNKW